MSRLIDRMEGSRGTGMEPMEPLKTKFIRTSSNAGTTGTDIPRIEINDTPFTRNVNNRDGTNSNSNTMNGYINQERERHRGRHRRNKIGIADYTSATIGTFSDTMFETSNASGSVSNNNNIPTDRSTDNSPNVLRNNIDISEISLGNHIFSRPVSASTYANRLNRQSIPKVHRHKKSHLDEDPRSGSFNSDKKRLVNEFLESMAPIGETTTKSSGFFFPSSTTASSTNIKNKFNISDMAPTYRNDSQQSLQSLLYHDLENSPMSEVSKGYPKLQLHSSASRTSLRSSVSDISGTSGTLSSSTASSFDSTNNGHIPIDDSDLALDFNDSDYNQQHIASKLRNIEMTMKTNLKDAIIKRETDFQKNIQDFDHVHLELENLRGHISRMKSLVNDNYLLKLNKDFEQNDPESYESQLKISVEDSVKRLETLERRMEDSKNHLDEQKEIMKRLDSILSLENTVFTSRQNMNPFSKYRYVIFDTATIIAVVFLAVFIYRHLDIIISFIKH